MAEICDKLSADLLKVCPPNAPVQGIEQKIVLINTDDLLATGITFDVTNPGELITALGLESGKSGFIVDGLKSIMNFGVSFETPADAESGTIHSINGIRIQDPSVEAQKQLNAFLLGAKVFAVVESKWKGASSVNAFKFFGLKHGLVLTSDSVLNSNENDGTAVISLRTPEGFKEPYVPHQYLDADYPTSLTAFNNKFLAP